MRYYSNFKSITGKLISAFLVVCVVMSCILVVAPQTATEDAYAASGVGSIEVKRDEHISKDRADGNIYSGNQISFKVNLPSEPTLLTVNIGTYGTAPGACEVRLGSKTGEVLAYFDTKAVGSWKSYEMTTSLTKELVGEQTIVFVGTAGVCSVDSFSFWLPGPNGGRYPRYPYADNYGDISDLEQREEINMVSDLGLIDKADDKRFNPNMAVTRGDFATYLSRMYNTSGGTYAADVFKDLPKTNEYCEPVSTLIQFGVIKQDATKFRPYDFITLDEAVDWILEISGYEMRDNRKTKLAFAASKDLLDEVNRDAKYITKADMAALIYNVISCIPSDIDYYYGNKEFTVNTGNVLEGKNIYYGEGFLEANELFSVNSNEETADSNSVLIDGKTYWQNKCYSASSYVGMSVRYFYKQEGNGNAEMLAIAPHEDNVVLALDGNDYDFVEINNSMISYYEDDAAREPEEIELNSSVRIMYNDKLVDSDISELLAIDDITRPEDFRGEIFLIDFDDDEEYDVLRIYNSVSIIFGGISNEGVSDILRGEVIPFDSENDVMLYKGAVMTDFKSMIYGDAFDIYRTHNEKGNKMFRIVITSDVTDEIFMSNDENIYVTEAGDKLEVYPRVAPEFEVEFGKEYSVQKNQFGQIILVKPYLNDSYGIFLDYASDEDDFGESENFVKLLDSTGAEKIYPVAQKAYIEGAYLKTGAEQKAALSLIPSEKNGSRYVVFKYRVNDKGEVSLIDSPVMGPDSEQYDKALRDKFTSLTNDEIVELQPKGNVYMDYDAGRVGRYPINSVITKFTRLSSSSGGEPTWAITNTLGSEDGNVKSEIFADDDREIAIGEFVIQYKATSSKNCTQYRIVNNISYSVDADGDEVIYLELLDAKNNTKVKVQKMSFENDVDFAAKIKGIKKGDIITASFDAAGDIQDFLYVYFVDGAVSRTANGRTFYSILNNESVYNGKNNTSVTIDELTNGHMRHGEVIAVNGSFIKYKWWTKSGESFVETEEWTYCSGSVTLVSENEYGDLLIENNKGPENFTVGDHVVIPHVRLVYSCSTPYILRTHALNNPMEVD